MAHCHTVCGDQLLEGLTALVNGRVNLCLGVTADEVNDDVPAVLLESGIRKFDVDTRTDVFSDVLISDGGVVHDVLLLLRDDSVELAKFL